MVKSEFSVAFVLLLSVSLFHFQCLGTEDVKGYPPSSNCATIECAPYQVVHSQKELEIRVYKNSTWVSSSIITASSYAKAAGIGFLELVLYADGNNLIEAKWNVTEPAIAKILPNSSVIVSLYLPQKLQNNPPPLPNFTNPITFVNLPRKKFAAVTRVDTVELTERTIGPSLATLRKNLRGTPWQVAATSSDYVTATYDDANLSAKPIFEIILWFDQN